MLKNPGPPSGWTSHDIGETLRFAEFIGWMKLIENAPDAEMHAGFLAHMLATFYAKAAEESRSQESIDEQLASTADWVKNAKQKYQECN